MISSLQRPLPDSTQHSQQTNLRAPGGIRTHNLSRRAAADLRLRPLGHWDRRNSPLVELLVNNLSRRAAADLRLRPRDHWDRRNSPLVELLANNLSRRAAADLRLRPRGHWDRRNLR